MLPRSSHATATTWQPAITALAGFVPCAETGMRHTSRCAWPRDSWYARMTSNPVCSPAAPEFGWSDTAGRPVISASHFCSPANSSAYPSACSGGTNGCRFARSGHEIGSIKTVPLSFIVHEPSGIID